MPFNKPNYADASSLGLVRKWRDEKPNEKVLWCTGVFFFLYLYRVSDKDIEEVETSPGAQRK